MTHHLKYKIIFFFVYFLSLTSESFACSGFKLTVNGKTMVGLNEDNWNPNTIIWTRKPTKKTFGAVFFGYIDSPRESGINDKGLIFDVFTSPTRKSHSKNINAIQSDVQSFKENLLLSCGTVKEAIVYLNKFNLDILNGVQLFIADKEGNSIVVELDTIIKSNTNYQIVTNFNQSQISDKNPITCNRYNAGIQILSRNQEYSVEYGKKMLKAMQDTIGTQYSQIFDLSSGTIHLYLFHNYDEEIVLKVNDLITQEINKPIQSYFKNKSNYNIFLSNVETTIRISGELNKSTRIEALNNYIDTLVLESNLFPQLFVDSLIKLGIHFEKINETVKSQIVYDSFSKFTFKINGYYLFEYYVAEIEANQNHWTEARQHIEAAIKKRPENSDFQLLKAKIDKHISQMR